LSRRRAEQEKNDPDAQAEEFRQIMSDETKIADDIYMVPWSEGNGQIRREAWVDGEGKTTRYYLAYLNQDALSADEGRVLGYAFENGGFVSHQMGAITAGEFSSFEALEENFDIKWNNLPKESGPVIPEGGSSAAANRADEHDEYMEIKGMRLTITKGVAADFFRRGKALARKLDRGERIESEKIVIFGDRHDLCYSQMKKR
jgi:hypothetical protein